MPIGDRALLVRYADTLSEAANRMAVALSRALAAEPIAGVAEIAPGLVSVLLRVDDGTDLRTIRDEVMLRLGAAPPEVSALEHIVEIMFDGEDLDGVAM